MIVYVESNFILEIALNQKQKVSAEAVLQLAEDAKIELVYPSFALSEPFATITRRRRDQERLGKSLANMLDTLQPMLADAASKEQDKLWSTVNRLVKVGKPLETNISSLNEALEYQDRYRLSPQDSIIYARVITDLKSRPDTSFKCFMNSNYKDFETPLILSELNSYLCRYERNFAKGLNFIQSRF